MWYEDPVFIAPLTLLLGAGGGYVVTWLSSRKQRVERTEREAALTSELRTGELQRQLEEQKRAAAEAARLETVAVDLRASQAETARALAALTYKQDTMAAVVTQTHELSNSSKTAMEKIEAGLRAELKAAELAAANAARLAETQLQLVRTEAAGALALKQAEIVDLQRQLQTLALSLPSLAPLAALEPAAPMPVVLTDQDGQPAPLPLQVVVRERT